MRSWPISWVAIFFSSFNRFFVFYRFSFYSIFRDCGLVHAVYLMIGWSRFELSLVNVCLSNSKHWRRFEIACSPAADLLFSYSCFQDRYSAFYSVRLSRKRCDLGRSVTSLYRRDVIVRSRALVRLLARLASDARAWEWLDWLEVRLSSRVSSRIEVEMSGWRHSARDRQTKEMRSGSAEGGWWDCEGEGLRDYRDVPPHYFIFVTSLLFLVLASSEPRLGRSYSISFIAVL